MLSSITHRIHVPGQIPSHTSLHTTVQITPPQGLIPNAYPHDPWLCMRQSRKRQCIVTRQILPSDFMIRLRPVQVKQNESTVSTYLVPDGISHPRWHPHRFNKGFWIACHPDVIASLASRTGNLRHTLRECGPLKVHPRIGEQISSLLQQRALQEGEMLRMRSTSLLSKLENITEAPRILRQLDDEELAQLQSTTEKVFNEKIISIIDLSPNISSTRFIYSGERIIPLHSLQTLFPSNHSQLFANALRKIVNFGNSHIPTSGSDTSLLALCTYGIQLKQSSQSDITIPLAVSLMRLQLWAKTGWMPVH